MTVSQAITYLVAYLPIPASSLLLGVDKSSNPWQKRDSLRELFRLSFIFVRELMYHEEIIRKASEFLMSPFSCPSENFEADG
jgi:hypothetical protein